MSTISTIAKAVLVALATVSIASAQHKVTPASKPAVNGPSLEVTLKFIQDKIGQEGRLTYSAAVTDTAQQDVSWKNNFVVELSNPFFNVAACSITYHWHAEVNGKLADDNNYTLNFRELSKIVKLPLEENQH
jgi:hypothetical protein